jgi:ubiquitin-like-conjugating enzyme ATG10
MDVVSAFPFLTKGDFFKACEHVQRVLPNSVLLLLADDSPCLRITRRFINEPVNPHADNNDDDDNNNNIHDRDEDDDQEEEAVVKAPQSEQHVVTVQYDVLLSPSYRVPVVYMMASPPLPLSHFVDLVVPHHFQDAVRATGVMGALSMTVTANRASLHIHADSLPTGPS